MEYAKWFYPAQAEIEIKFHEFFKDWSCSFQQVSKDRITEFYNVVEADGKLSQVMVSIIKVSGKDKYRVFIYSANCFCTIN